jgi:hypothetical protein
VPPNRRTVVLALGASQTVAWGSSYYLPAILAEPMARDLGLAPPWVFGAFSAALVLSALLGPSVGRAIDRRGGRPVLASSNGVLALGLCLLAAAQGPGTLAAAWLVLGAGIALGLYDAAFATLAGLYGREARGAITGVTLVAGFASTVGWPLSAAFEGQFGWRGACLAWAGLNLALALPLNLLLVPRAPPPDRAAAAAEGEAATAPRPASPRRCSPSCSPPCGSPPGPWPRTCPACSAPPGRGRPKRSPPPRCSARRRSRPGSRSSGCSAGRTRSCPPGSRRSATRRASWRSCWCRAAARRRRPSRCCTARATA